jgi:hypothetical protein
LIIALFQALPWSKIRFSTDSLGTKASGAPETLFPRGCRSRIANLARDEQQGSATLKSVNIS